MARTYDDEKALGRVRRSLLKWFNILSEVGDVEENIPSLSEGQHRAMKSGLELFNRLLKEETGGKDKQIIVNLENVPLEELKRRAKK